MSCNGKILPIPSKLTIIKDQKNVEELKVYFEDREYGHFICLEYPSQCQK